MRILITGANGMLGQALQNVLSYDHELICSDIDDFNITDIEYTQKWIKKVRPEIVIHAAAYTDVDGCESNEELAYRVNGLGARNVAAACSEVDARMIFISSDYIFDGTKKRNYREYDEVNPLNVYGKSKLLGEILVKEVLNNHCIVRTSWLFGPYGKNFVKTMLTLSQKTKEISVVNDQIGSPTYTIDLAEAICKLASGHYRGTYHITNSNCCSWYDFARDIFQVKGADIQLYPITTEELGRPALRPAYSVLDNYLWELEGFGRLRSYQEALGEYLESFQEDALL